MEKMLGKIKKARFGIGGYQYAMIGLWLDLGGEEWGVNTSIDAGWSLMIKVGENTKWSEEDRSRQFAEAMRKINQLLIDAKVYSVDQLAGIPVEAEFERMQLKDWRVLKEVL